MSNTNETIFILLVDNERRKRLKGAWWNGRHNRLKICRPQAVRVRVPERPPNKEIMR